MPKKVKINLIRTQFGILPVYDEDKELLSSIPLDEPQQYTLTNPRNIGHHNKLMKLIRIVYDNVPEGFGYTNNFGHHVEIVNVEMLLDQIKIQQGFVEPELDAITGVSKPVVKSINFDSLSQHDFQTFYERSIDIIIDNFLQDTGRDEFFKVLDGETLGSNLHVTRRPPFRVIIAGSRNFQDYEFLSEKVVKVLTKKETKHKIEICCGMAAGADELGRLLALEQNWKVNKFPADWDDVKAEGAVVRMTKQGKPFNVAAGHLRNQQMADFADCLVAFRIGGSTGTTDMIKRAEKRGLGVIIYDVTTEGDKVIDYKFEKIN